MAIVEKILPGIDHKGITVRQREFSASGSFRNGYYEYYVEIEKRSHTRLLRIELFESPNKSADQTHSMTVELSCLRHNKAVKRPYFKALHKRVFSLKIKSDNDIDSIVALTARNFYGGLIYLDYIAGRALAALGAKIILRFPQS